MKTEPETPSALLRAAIELAQADPAASLELLRAAQSLAREQGDRGAETSLCLHAATIYIAHGQYDAALECYDNVLESGTAEAMVLVGRATVLDLCGRRAEAGEAFERAYQVATQDSDADAAEVALAGVERLRNTSEA